MEKDVLAELTAVLKARRDADPQSSYVASLYHKGLDVILKKIGEEAAETIVAAKNQNRQQLVYEMADLWFHSMVLLIDQGIEPKDVLVELERRFGCSGLEEKRNRDKAS